MNEKIKFEKDMIEPGKWTEEQKELINNLFQEIEKALKERFPYVSDNIKLQCRLCNEGIAVKIIASYSVEKDIYLGELDSRHQLEAFSKYPEESKSLLTNMLNNHAVTVYEKVIMQALSEQLANLIQQTEMYQHKDDGSLIANGKRIIQSVSIPEDVVIMHPDTFDKLKQKGGANEPN
jgi:hypothetical protein